MLPEVGGSAGTHGATPPAVTVVTPALTNGWGSCTRAGSVGVMSETPDTLGEADAAPTIIVYSDYVCPFCYLGRRSLSSYQSDREQPLRIDWRPFDLRAGTRKPDGSIDHTADDGKDEAYYERAKQNVERLREEYDADEMTAELATEVDSLPAQLASVAVRDVYDYSTWLDFDEAVFAALWHEGRDIGDEDVLVDIAAEAGVDPDDVRDALGDDGRRAALRERFQEAKSDGITGVPTFVADGHAARGAVPPEQLERLVGGR
jgi:predicted DsbA family dithiol-disulfide isomerase